MSISYQNPLNIKNIGDPFVLRTANGVYYCYATSAPDGFKAWSSRNLVDWKPAGYVYQRRPDSWGISEFWAPEVIEKDRRFYMHYTARWGTNDSLRLGVAVADSPLGPFEDVTNSPLFDPGYATIDGHVFIDDDGKKYLYYARDCSENIIEGRHESHLYVVELGDDLVSLKGEPVWLTQPEQAWETSGDTAWAWNEGPFMIKHAGRYYLMYSGNFYASREYAVGYASANSPTGPFIKAANNPVLSSSSAEISGPGHNSITLTPDGRHLMIVYHTHTNPEDPGGNRQVCIDPMGFTEDGDLFVNGPTNTPQEI